MRTAEPQPARIQAFVITRLFAFSLVAAGTAAGCDGSASTTSPDAGSITTDAGSAVDGRASDAPVGAVDGGALDGATRDGGELDHLDMLRSLGVDTSLPSMPLGPDGNPLPAHYHPLRHRYSALRPRNEIYVAGWDVSGRTESVLEDGFDTSPYASRLTPRDATWLANQDRTAVAADVDGDGISEVVDVYFVAAEMQLRARVVDGTTSGASTTYADGTAMTLARSVMRVDWPAEYFKHAVTAANVDSDPADELVVGYNDLYVFDDAMHGFAPLMTVPLASRRISVTAGDFDAAPGDPTDELVVTFVDGPLTYVDTYDGLTLTSHRDALFALNDPDRTTFQFLEAFVAAGNFDHDPAQEIAFYGPRRDGGQWHVVMMDDANSGYSWFRSFQYWTSRYDSRFTPIAPVLEPLDIDGDHVDEIYADFWLVRGLAAVPPSSSRAVVSGDELQIPRGVTVTSLALGLETFPVPRYSRVTEVASGDVSPVGEVAPDRVGTEELVALHPATGELLVGTFDSSSRFSWVPIGRGGTTSSRGAVVVANMDADSPIVRFDDEHDLTYSDPQVVALLSAAPFYDVASGVSQNLGNCYTSFGVARMETMSRERSYGLTMGWSVGYEADFLFGAAKASWKLTFEAGFDRVAASGREIYDSITYATGVEDSVVMTTVPYDVYFYTVVSTPPGRESELGQRMTINVPRQSQTRLVTQAFYDAHNGSLPDTGPLFHHTVGNPRSYRNSAAVMAECTHGCFSSRRATVGEGTGFTEVLVSDGVSETRRESFDFAITLEVEASVGGWSAGRSSRFHYGSAIQASTTQYTVFTGRVGHITGLTPARTYSFGLVAYPTAFGGASNRTMFLDYWVE